VHSGPWAGAAEALRWPLVSGRGSDISVGIGASSLNTKYVVCNPRWNRVRACGHSGLQLRERARTTQSVGKPDGSLNQSTG
jgi:hypothetical protein